MKNNTLTRYNNMAQLLHWLMAIVIIIEISIALIAEDMSEGMALDNLVQTHKSMGVVLLLLIVTRVIWRLFRGGLAPMDALSVRSKQLSQLGHRCFYVLMIFMPLSGWLMSSSGGHSISVFGLVQLPALISENNSLHEIFESSHVIAGKLMILLILIHVVAILKHQALDGHKIMSRMLPKSHAK